MLFITITPVIPENTQGGCLSVMKMVARNYPSGPENITDHVAAF